MQKIDIVGGSGFIGTRLIRRLQLNREYDTSIVDKNPSFEFCDLVKYADVRNLEQLKGAISENSVIVNLAAEHRDNVNPISLYHEVNVKGAQNLCAIAKEKNIKTIIFTSSVAVYGFAPIGTSEKGAINPFNDYGRTKYEAENIFKSWQQENASERTLVIIRPTVVFGEQNRGNVYNLLRQVSSGKFLMVGHGDNRKSMAYVENVSAFIEYCLAFTPGVYVYNFIDKPDFTMNKLVENVNHMLGKNQKTPLRISYRLGLFIGMLFDFAAYLTGKTFAISYIRVKKFCSDSVYNTAIESTGFISPVSLEQALRQTVRYEFLEQKKSNVVFYSE
jgi:nucleoside-diphosphate-sugar epimerase